MNLGYLVGTAIFAAIFVGAVSIQISASRVPPLPVLGDDNRLDDGRYDTRGFCGPLARASATPAVRLSCFALLVMSLVTWYRTLGSISVDTVSSPRAEMFYWVTIMFSQTLGTALGDWTADTAGLGYVGGAILFSALLALVVAAYFWTDISRTISCSGRRSC